MKPNQIARDAILEVVDNQIKSGDPPETRVTYKRLLEAGIAEPEVKRLIACVVASEMFEIMRSERAFDLDRFVKALNRLPELPN